MRFLIIEEDCFVSSLLTEKLKNGFNCMVDQAQYAQKAMRLLKSERPYDFIIADLRLGFKVYCFHRRHKLSGDYIFFSNCPKILSIGLKMNVSSVPRSAFANLEKHIINTK